DNRSFREAICYPAFLRVAVFLAGVALVFAVVVLVGFAALADFGAAFRGADFFAAVFEDAAFFRAGFAPPSPRLFFSASIRFTTLPEGSFWFSGSRISRFSILASISS